MLSDLTRIPLSVPDLSGNEEAYASEAIRSSWISSSGAFVQRFEREFANFCGSGSALSVTNGTDALHLALIARGVGPGDEVLLPSLTYVATANAVRYVGAEPVFVDIDAGTWCLDPLDIERRITDQSRAIIAVHLYGHPADMDAINAVAARHGLPVIEDAAEAHGATYKGRICGSLADCATFSFYGNKILTSGEGGALTTSDPELAQRARLFRGQGMDPERRYFFPVIGHNFRLTNVACAILCAQLERYHDIAQRRSAVVRQYRDLLGSTPGLGMQPVASWARPAPWLFSLTVDAETFGRSRDDVMDHLARRGIETRPFFVPLHSLPPYAAPTQEDGATLPITVRIAAAGLNLPTYPTLSEGAVLRVAETLLSIPR